MLYRRRVWVGVRYFRKKLGLQAQQVRDWLARDHGFTVLEVPDSTGRIRRYVPLDELEGESLEKSLPKGKEYGTPTTRIRITRPEYRVPTD